MSVLGGEEHFGRLFTFKFLSALSTEKNKYAKTCYPAEKKILRINGKQTWNYRPISSYHWLYEIVFWGFSSVH